MKRPRTKSALSRLSRDAERLVALASGLAESGSRVEDAYWEGLLDGDVARLLERGADAGIDTALHYLDAVLPPAHEVLIEAVETQAESQTVEHYQMLLVAAPILAWSKYAIPSGPLDAEVTGTLRAHLQAHITASDARFALAPYLYSIDQLPRLFSETRALTLALGKGALGSKEVAGRSSKKMPETAPLLADTRYLLGTVVARLGAPLFRWQEDPQFGRLPILRKDPGKEKFDDRKTNGRKAALEEWRAQGHPNLAAALTGCVFELQLPDGYHTACRNADRAIRPYSVKAALAFLEAALAVEPKQLRAVLGVFGGEEPEEYRIGLTLRNSAEVVHGAIWPLYGEEEASAPGSAQQEIETLLREAGVGDIVTLEQGFPMEFCEDCGSPLFADPAGDMVHAELPEDTEAPSQKHLH